MLNFSRTPTVLLATNENPYPINPKVLRVVTDSLKNLNRYPDDAAKSLRAKLAKLNSVDFDQISIGAGSSEIIELIMRSFLFRGKTLLISKYAFLLYKTLANVISSAVVEVSPKNWEIKIEDFIDAIDETVSIIIIANPNNPTGSYLTINEIKELLKCLPHNIIIVIDEAYYEYVMGPGYESAASLISSYPNLVVTRTFSKIYGLASLRIGYCIASPKIVKIINYVKKPFNVSTQAIIAAETAIDCQGYINSIKWLNQQQLNYLKNALNKLGIKYLDFCANYLCMYTGVHTQNISSHLMKSGILTRKLDEYGMPNYIRVTVGLPVENQLLINQLGQWMNLETQINAA